MIALTLVKTRTGQFTNPGGVCALYAITWQPIDECKGKKLHVAPTNTPPRKFSLENQQLKGLKITNSENRNESDRKTD